MEPFSKFKLSENHPFTFKSAVSGEDWVHFRLLLWFVISRLLVILSLCGFIRSCMWYPYVILWRHVLVPLWFSAVFAVVLCVSVCFTVLFVRWRVLCRACMHVLVLLQQGYRFIKAQSPFCSFQNLQHHIHHNEVSIFLHTMEESLMKRKTLMIMSNAFIEKVWFFCYYDRFFLGVNKNRLSSN